MEPHCQTATPATRLAILVGSLLLTVLLLGARVESAAGAPTPASGTPVPSLEEELAEEREEEELEAREEELEAREEEFGAEEEFVGEDFPTEELGGTDCELAEEGLAEGLLTPVDVEDLCTAEEEWLAELTGHRSRARSSARGGRWARSRCALRSVRVHAVTRRKGLRLTIGYTSSEPTTARIEVRLGKRRVGVVRRGLHRNGALRLTRRVGKNWAGRVRVRLKAPSCSRLWLRSTKVR